MASFTAIVNQVLMKVPVDKRPLEKANVELLVTSSIETLSKIVKWDWKENYQDVTITSGTATYDLNDTVDFISGKQGFFVDSSGNPTKNRLVVIDEDTFNQMYVAYVADDDSETAAIPKYIVALTRVSNTGAIRFRLFPTPSQSLIARVFYFEKPALGHAAHMIESMILYETYSKMPIEWVGDPTYWASQSLSMQSKLMPMEKKSSTGAPVVGQDLRFVNALKKINSGGASR